MPGFFSPFNADLADSNSAFFQLFGKNQMNTQDLTKLAIAGGILFAAYKFGPGWAKAGALAVAAGIVAKRVPYVKDVL